MPVQKIVAELKSRDNTMSGNKKAGKLAANSRSELISEVFKYVLVAVVASLIFAGGYKIIEMVQSSLCNAELSEFELDVRGIGENLNFGSKELQTQKTPCDADRIYFFDLGRGMVPELINETPLVTKLVEGGTSNVFIIKDNDIRHHFNAGGITIDYPHYICLQTNLGSISYYAAGAGNSAKITVKDGQPECTVIPEQLTEPEAADVLAQAMAFENKPISDLEQEKERAELTGKKMYVVRNFKAPRGKTKVEIMLTPKKGTIFTDLKFYETIPKECIADLTDFLESMDKDHDVIVRTQDDPLILWSFTEVSGQRKVSYTLTKELSRECREQIKGLAIAQFIGTGDNRGESDD